MGKYHCHSHLIVINAAIRVGLEEYNFLPFNNPSPQGVLNVLNNTAFTLEQGDTLSKVSHLFLQLLCDLCQGKSQFRLLQCNFCKVGLKRRACTRSYKHPHHTSKWNYFHLITASSGFCKGEYFFFLKKKKEYIAEKKKHKQKQTNNNNGKKQTNKTPEVIIALLYQAVSSHTSLQSAR